ncbi:Hcp family type VI secretion system effector [Azohydromonas caseinilytica]|uniref:Type VI secretion system tube protein Hcp n=1 Tax=Azohydromonas caseinilytica TaxID=2728836 RepID=A0A848FEH4_9BURK|nr:type VI secretion system tube protein Hcp [Azohydromonas caseinilytica]NML16550.1 type VI secretion system tube protein Hcp [Azohydromonas caseinilytica]
MAAAPGSRSDMFLHVQAKRAGKIKGESTTAGHEGDIEVLAWDWGVSASAALGALGTAERRAYRHLVLRKHIDASSTGLLSALVSNDEVREAVLTLRKAGGEALDYFTMKLGNARVVAVDIEVDAQGLTLERVTLAFTRIDIEYQPQAASGQGSGTCVFSDEILGG